MFPLPHAAPDHQPNSRFFCSTHAASILSSRPRNVSPSRAAAVKDGRSCGRPKGLSLTAASTMAASSGSGRGGAHRATGWLALLTSADVPKMSWCNLAISLAGAARCEVGHRDMSPDTGPGGAAVTDERSEQVRPRPIQEQIDRRCA
jgi:hypothetical protein